MDELKFCINCKFHQGSQYTTELENMDKCVRPEKINLVTGQPLLIYCSSERNSVFRDDACGYTAKHFEQKEGE